MQTFGLRTRATDSHRANSRLLKKALRLVEKDDVSTVIHVNSATIIDNYKLCGIDKYIELINKEHKPYQDKQRSCDQLEDLKHYPASLEKELKAKEIFTEQECSEQNKKVCKLAMLVIRLDGTLKRETRFF